MYGRMGSTATVQRQAARRSMVGWRATAACHRLAADYGGVAGPRGGALLLRCYPSASSFVAARGKEFCPGTISLFVCTLYSVLYSTATAVGTVQLYRTAVPGSTIVVL